MVLDVLLDRLDSLPVLLLARDVPLLLVRHPVLQAQGLDSLKLEALPRLPILRLPVLGGDRTLFRMRDELRWNLLKSFLSTLRR